MTDKKRDNLLFFSWAISVIATFGSLYFSEIKHFEPCELCWFQRLFMYPLALMLGVAYVKKDWNISLYASLLSGIGGTISIYHYLLQKWPDLHQHDFCGIIPCTGQYIDWAGFITIPFLALIAFSMIFGINIYLWKLNQGGTNH
ncbi:disulfide oxidoreductase [Fervidibacillus halotolerans]|uniref:Probable disulfide formation protein n=1 Tax=Fervidibacillus halotolerans TaxID=2980027 RepID=A0A9E8S1U1_9BACI|nr:disulfide oxidoreductase [Fervidibacillus halotolerans]WAA13862.1 disulfide oxidoreductase [Fervidibacillus halotolerans]